MRTTAEVAARHLLQRFYQAHPHWNDERTPLDELVSWLGMEIATFHPADQPETYGYVDEDESEQLIWLRRDLPENIRRFTLAHELGHAVLHCHTNPQITELWHVLNEQGIWLDEHKEMPELSSEDPCRASDVQEDVFSFHDQLQELLGPGEPYDPRSQRELAANFFAAELLMPWERVRTLYLTQAVAPKTLAHLFAVSSAAMLNRLAELLHTSMEEDADTRADGHNQQPPASTPARKRYDEFQQAAIEAPTPALIVAGPGSGKTSTLIGRTEYLIQTLGVLPEHILALTFSRKAASEMEERLQSLLTGDIRKYHSQSVPAISTFHAFCANLLRQYGTLVGLRSDFGLIDEAEGYFLLRQMANEIRLQHYQKLHAPMYYFPDILKAISRAKDELVTPDEYALLAQRMLEQASNDEEREKAEQALEVASIYALYEKALLERGDTDFGGLLVLAIQLLHNYPEVLTEQQQRYQHILVDEFQDVNRASGVLLRVLAGSERRVWVVGDANQAIYSFRGASPANISQFENDFTDAVVLPLSRNYRSKPDLVTLAEAFRCRTLELEQEPGKNQPVRLAEPTAYVTLAKARDEANELAGIIRDIRARLASGYTCKDIVVLCRTRAQAQKISRALAAAQLPIIESGSMLEQPYIKDVLSIPLLLIDPTGMGILRAAQQREHPLSQEDIEQFLQSALERKTNPGILIFNGDAPLHMSDSGQNSLKRISEILQMLHFSPDIWSLLAQYMLIETTLVRDLLLDRENKQKNAILADYDRLLQVARHYDRQQRVRDTQHGAPALEGSQQFPLATAIRGFLEYLSLLALLRQDGASRQGSGVSEEQVDVIRVMTVHASKGLEFPVVYLPGLVQQRFPLTGRSAQVPPPDGMLPPENVVHETGESCLFYVGVTRARDHLILSYSERYGKRAYKPSLYLDALEAGLPTERLTGLIWENLADAFLATDEEQDQIISSQPGEDFIRAMQSPTLKARQIEAYHRCPRQYAYNAIYHFQGEESTYRVFWQATQQSIEALRQRLKGSSSMMPPPMLSQEEIQQLYTQHWQELGGHTQPFALMYEEHGQTVVQSMQSKLHAQDSGWETHSKFTVDVAGKPVQVTVDRVETSPQTGSPVKFVRTRFGKRKEKPGAEMREFFYTQAYRQNHPGQSVELHSHNMSTGEEQPIKMTTRKEQSLHDQVERSIQGLERNEYPPQPSEPHRCPTCPFFFICPA